MKKIITLLLSAGIITASYAQGNYGHNNRYNRNKEYAPASHRGYNNRDYDRDDMYKNRNNSFVDQRQIQIGRINRQFNYKVWSIQHNRYMSNRQKRFAIRDAKKERNYQILTINRQMNGYANNSYGKYYYERR